MGEMTEDGEDDGAGQQRGEGVREADDESVLVSFMSELVVGAVGGESAEPNTQREEGLSHGSVPDLQTVQLLPLRSEEEEEALHGPRQSEAPDQQSQHDHVGEDGGEVCHLARAAHSLPVTRPGLHVFQLISCYFLLNPISNQTSGNQPWRARSGHRKQIATSQRKTY